MINCYTREPGVRGLERQISSLCRKVVHSKVRGERWSHRIDPEDVVALLGPEKFSEERVRPATIPGVVNGLAWTEAGGDILQIEVAIVPGKGKLTITGKLGSVMNESAQAAMTYVRSRSEILNIDKDYFQNVDIHIHVPEGAIPKDGPSAGVTMATALISAILSRPVDPTLAMTGEISLQGRALQIGGLKEKLMAAVRSGVKTVIIPEKNVKDLQEIGQEILDKLEIFPVADMDTLLARALNISFVPHGQGIKDVAVPEEAGIVTH
jgi:ATP-dependent Lon protease